jgi:hypothetical protein
MQFSFVAIAPKLSSRIKQLRNCVTVLHPVSILARRSRAGDCDMPQQTLGAHFVRLATVRELLNDLVCQRRIWRRSLER